MRFSCAVLVQRRHMVVSLVGAPQPGQVGALGLMVRGAHLVVLIGARMCARWGLALRTACVQWLMGGGGEGMSSALSDDW